MKNRTMATTFVFCAVLWTSVSYAAPYILSAEFLGDEPEMQNQDPNGEIKSLPYLVFDPITVSASGNYNIRDVRDSLGTDVTVSFHTGTFNPDNPSATQQEFVDDWGDVTLNSGTNYTLVIQPWDVADWLTLAAFGIYINGNGSVSGEWIHPLPSKWYGTFTGNETLTNIIPEFVGCEDSYHTVVGPLEVEMTGTHYFSAISNMSDDPMPLGMGVYDAEFDPANPYENQIGIFPNSGQVNLEVGKTYYLVLQPDCIIKTGDWSIMIAQPANLLHWTPFMAGSWSDPATAGQGLVLDVFPEIKAIFAAWFTWDTKEADPNDNSDVANSGTRWLTAFGNYENETDQVVEMTVYEAKGGLFNQGKVESNDPVGTLTIDMFNLCEGGEFRFNLDSGLSGSSLMKRNANDLLDDCRSVNPRAAVYQP
jgi:hypothetical protein